MRRAAKTLATPVVGLVIVVACGGGGEAAMHDAATADAATDAAGGGFTSCTGACRTTALTAMFSTTRVLDTAYYGVTQSDQTLHVEAYKNAPAGCPTMNSPNPDYTLVLGRVPIPSDATPSTSPGNILDFRGDLLGGPLGAQATAVTITPAAADRPTASDGFVALDLALTFPSGTVTGHLFATHCASLDGP